MPTVYDLTRRAAHRSPRRVGRARVPREAGLVAAVEARRDLRPDVRCLAGAAGTAGRGATARCRGPDRAHGRPRRDPQGLAPARRPACGRGRADGLPGPRHGVHLVAGGLRDGVHVLRHRPDGAAEQPHGGRDRRASGVGAPRSGAPARHRRRSGSRTSCSWGWASPSRTSDTSSPRSRGSPTRARSGWARGTSRSRRSGSCPGSSGWPSASRRSGLRSASTPRATSCAISSSRRTRAIRSRGSRRDRGLARDTHRRPSIEWALIDRVNDTTEQAELLAPIARRLGAHVNLIPLNPTPGYPVLGSPPARIRRFVADARASSASNVTVRDTRGRSIDAACGQLALATD